jgi:two-component system, sensor histidine kinase and response regulator
MSEIQDPERLIQELTEQNTRKTQFISTVSHEFRTYITALSMNIQMLEMYDSKWPPEKKVTVFRRLQNSMKSMIRLLDEVSFLSKDFDNRLTLAFSDFDVLSFCRESVEKLNSAGENQVPVVLTEGQVPSSVQTDSSLFNLIVTNLLINAVKFSPAGKAVNLSIGIEENKYLKIVVTDHGIGIPAEELEHVYEAFYRAKNALQFAGSGLGLTVVQRSVDLLKGTIAIRTEVDQGTEITVMLPLALPV